MNIAHISPTYYPAIYWGGPISYDYGLNNALARLPGNVVKVLTTDVAGPKKNDLLDVNSIDEDIYPNQEVIFAHRIAGHCVSWELLYKISSIVRWADVVRLSATYSFPTIPTLALCRLYDKPLIWTLHGAILDTHVWDGAPRRRLKRLWEYGCDALIRRNGVVLHTMAQPEKDSAETRISNARAVIVPNGVHVPPIFPQQEWLPNGRLRLMYLGRLAKKKGIENLLHAIKILSDPSISLAIYGAGDATYVKSLHALTDDLGLKSSVSFMGEVTGDDKNKAMVTADMCIVPSHTESFCIVVAEALAHGLPVIASHGTPWQELEAKRCGWWVDNSPQSLAQTIERSRSMPLDEMGRRGWEWMGAEYSWDAVAKQMMVVCRDLLTLRG